MALETVRVIVKDTEVPQGVISGVNVRVFTDAEVFVTSAVTNGSGIADFTVDGDGSGIDYHVRFFKDTVTFSSPYNLSVYSPAGAAPSGTNDFEVEGDINAASAPANTDLCRCYGYFRDVDGNPSYPLEIRFQTLYSPMMVNGVMVSTTPFYAETDSDGYMSVDLYRGATLMVSLAGQHIDPDCGNYQRDILVPDRGTCNIHDLIFPVVIDVSWSPADPFSLAVGGTLDITPTITATNYQVLEGTALRDVTYSVADESVAVIDVQDTTKLTLRGVSVGSTTLTVSRRDETIVRVPDTISGASSTINVT